MSKPELLQLPVSKLECPALPAALSSQVHHLASAVLFARDSTLALLKTVVTDVPVYCQKGRYHPVSCLVHLACMKSILPDHPVRVVVRRGVGLQAIRQMQAMHLELSAFLPFPTADLRQLQLQLQDAFDLRPMFQVSQLARIFECERTRFYKGASARKRCVSSTRGVIALDKVLHQIPDPGRR